MGNPKREGLVDWLLTYLLAKFKKEEAVWSLKRVAGCLGLLETTCESGLFLCFGFNFNFNLGLRFGLGLGLSFVVARRLKLAAC